MKRLIPLVAALAFSAALNAQAPVANFSADTNFACAGQSLGFFDQSTNSPTSWTWSFPGGTPSSSNLQNPTITYNVPGVYSVTLTAANSFGSNTFTRTNYISISAPPTVSNAGPNQTICVTTTTVTMAANTPTSGTGQWSVINGTGTFANASSPTTTVTGMSVGINTYRWTISSPPCPASISQVVITVSALPSLANAGPDQQLCGSTTATLAGNTPAVGTGTWTLIGGTGTITNPSLPNSGVTGLSIGANSFQWTISNGACPPRMDTVVITVNPNPSVVITPNIASICIGQNVGLTASGASTYSWSPSTGLSATTGASVTASPTVTTSYMVTGTASNGCTSASSVTVFVNSYPTVTVTPTSANVCSNSTVTLTASGAPFYSWSPASGLSATTGSSVNAIPTVTTTYTVTGNNNGCTATTTTTITPIPAPSASVSPTSALVCNGNNVTLTASGGTSYSWSPATGLSATTGASVVAGPNTSTSYTVTVTGSNGCTATAVAVVAVNQPPNVIITPVSASICIGDTVTLTASGAQNYSWSPATGLSSTTAAIVMAFPTATTTYTVTGSTPSCGNSIKLVTVTVNPLPVVTVTPANSAICLGSFVNLNAGGALTYSWSPSAGLSSTSGAVVTANPTVTTTYTCTGTSSFGCRASAAATVTVNPNFTVNTSSTPVACGNGNNGTATASPVGGTPPFTYSWSDPFGQTTATSFGLSAGNYSVVVTDVNGCTRTATVTVSSVNAMAMNITYTNVLCYGGNTGTALVSVSGGTLPYTYTWSPGNQSTAAANNLAAGTYTITVRDNNNCVQSISVTIAQPPAMLTTVSRANGKCHNLNGSASVSVTGGTPPYTYSWSNGRTSQIISGIGEGKYVITVRDNNGCIKKDSVNVNNIETDDCLFIPNAFSPNGDGNHDLWIISNIDLYNNVQVSIYNRWGNKVYESSDYKNNWDGTGSDGQKLPGGVYYYLIDFSRGAKTAQGTVTLIR